MLNLAFIAQSKTTELNANTAASILRKRPSGAKTIVAAAINAIAMTSSAKLPAASPNLNPNNHSVANATTRIASAKAAGLIDERWFGERFIAAVCRNAAKTPMSAIHPQATVRSRPIAVLRSMPQPEAWTHSVIGGMDEAASIAVRRSILCRQ